MILQPSAAVTISHTSQAGAVAAFTIDLLVYPLDTLKTRYQSQDYVKIDASSPLRKPLALRGLYQGVGSVILATVPAAGIFFSTYENTKVFFGRTLSAPDPVIHSSASAVAEMASCLVLAPAEVIKSNAQMLASKAQTTSSSSTGRHSTSIEAFRMLARSPNAGNGAGATKMVVRRLFTGYTALVARNLPFTALQFPAFEYLRSKLWERRHGDMANTDRASRGLLETGLVSGVSAGTAGALAAYITTPSDVVKVRMMLFASESGGDGDAQVSGQEEKLKRSGRGAWATTRRVYAERGVRGFFRGGVFRGAWTALGSGLYLGTYETAKLWLTRGKEKPEDDGI